ncbi:jg1754, partial [Pararge aegeria aegeria]
LDALDLSHNELSNDLRLQLPAGPHLKRLILDLNDFTSVPSFVLDCGHLEQLSMAHNDLKHISDAAVHALARSLERLDLDHNELAALPARLRDLAGLSRLSLAYNLLEDVAELPPNLRYLSLAGNFLATFPTGLRHLNPMSLKYLDLGYNRISHVAAEHFSAWAGALATLSLRGNRLAQLSLGSFPPLRLRELVLSFNDLYGVEAGVFSNLTELRVLELSAALPGGMLPRGAPAVTWLNLDNNNIHLVSSNDLLGYPALEYLNLDFNKLIEFPSETSSSNVSYRLKELRLSYNYISKINSVFLEEVPELQSVDLSYNRMQNISQRGFYNLGNLVYLNLAGNVVELIADEAFVDLPKLEVLNLQENNLAELSTRCLSNVSNEGTNFAVNVSYNRLTTLSGGKLVSINVLDLSHNLLQSISRDFFDSVGQHVRQIFLSHNKLLLIDTSVFGTLPNLNVLNLHKNNISMVKRRAFSEMPSLQMVDLSDNHIEQLAPEQFHGLRRLRQLRLAR